MKSNAQVLLAFVAGALAGAAVAVGVVKLSRTPVAASSGIASAKGGEVPASTQALTRLSREGRQDRGAWWNEDAPTPSIDDAMPRGFSSRWAGSSRSVDSTNGTPQTADDQRRQWMEEGFQRFQTYWSNQTVEARSNVIRDAKLSNDDIQRFDVVVASMNLRLSSLLDPVLEDFQNGWRPTAEERANLLHDVSGVLVTTYDEMSKNLPPEWSDAANSNDVSLAQFADPKYSPFLRSMRSWHGRSDGGPRGGPVGSQNR